MVTYDYHVAAAERDRLRAELEKLRSDTERALRNRDTTIDGMRDKCEAVIKERDALKKQAATHDCGATHERTFLALREEQIGRKRDAEDFVRRVKQQEHYFNAKIRGIFHNRDQIAESLRKAESERRKYRMLYESTQERTSISLGVENGNLRKKINQLQQQKRKWKRLHAEAVRENTVVFGASDALGKCVEQAKELEDLKVKLNSMTWARDFLGDENRALRDRLRKAGGDPDKAINSAAYVKPDQNPTINMRLADLEQRVTKIEKDLDW